LPGSSDKRLALLVLIGPGGFANEHARIYGEPPCSCKYLVRWGPDGRTVSFRRQDAGMLLSRSLVRIAAPGDDLDWHDDDAHYSAAAALGSDHWIFMAGNADAGAVLPGGLTPAAGPFVAKVQAP